MKFIRLLIFICVLAVAGVGSPVSAATDNVRSILLRLTEMKNISSTEKEFLFLHDELISAMQEVLQGDDIDIRDITFDLSPRWHVKELSGIAKDSLSLAWWAVDVLSESGKYRARRFLEEHVKVWNEAKKSFANPMKAYRRWVVDWIIDMRDLVEDRDLISDSEFRKKARVLEAGLLEEIRRAIVAGISPYDIEIILSEEFNWLADAVSINPDDKAVREFERLKDFVTVEIAAFTLTDGDNERSMNIWRLTRDFYSMHRKVLNLERIQDALLEIRRSVGSYWDLLRGMAESGKFDFERVYYFLDSIVWSVFNAHKERASLDEIVEYLGEIPSDLVASAEKIPELKRSVDIFAELVAEHKESAFAAEEIAGGESALAALLGRAPDKNLWRNLLVLKEEVESKRGERISPKLLVAGAVLARAALSRNETREGVEAYREFMSSLKRGRPVLSIGLYTDEDLLPALMRVKQNSRRLIDFERIRESALRRPIF